MGRVGESGKASGVNSASVRDGAAGSSGAVSVEGRLVEQADRIRVQKRSARINLVISLRRVVHLLCSAIKRAGDYPALEGDLFQDVCGCSCHEGGTRDHGLFIKVKFRVMMVVVEIFFIVG